MTNQAGRAPGSIGDGQSVALFSLRCGLTLNDISGGAIDISDAATGDSIADIFVSTHPTEDLLGGDTVAWATDDATFARLIATKINEKANEHHYWATHASNHVYIWPQDGSAADSGTITADDTGFTASIANMNSEQAFAAATKWVSGNYGVDAFGGTTMKRIGFDFSNFRSIDTNWDLSQLKGVELVLQTEDATLTVYTGPGGNIVLSATPSDNDIEERTFGVLGHSMGLLGLFAQSGGAQNPTYHLRTW